MSKVLSLMFAITIGVVGGGVLGANVALAQDSQPAPPAMAEASAEVKMAKGVENREPVEEGTTFPAGTTVWAWSLIRNSEGEVKHVWKKDGTAVWTANLNVGSKKWTTYSRRKLTKAGSYSVDVVGPGDAVLGTASFTIE